MSLLTREEKQVVETLAEDWDAFIALPELHSVDQHEFMRAIHSAQNIVLSRSYLREKQETKEGDKE